MSVAAIATTVGTVSASSKKVVAAVVPAETNSLAHVQVNPDSGRIIMRNNATGYQHSSTPSITTGTTTIVLEPA